MKHAKPVAGLLALLAGLALSDAAAQQAQVSAQAAQEQHEGVPQAQEEQAGNAALQPPRKPGGQAVQGQPQGKPGKTAQQKKLPPRRAVPAIIGSMPAPSAPQAYGPVLHELAPQTTMPAPAPAGLPPPATITGCIGNQCNDTSGKSYQTGVGNTAIDPNGRLCNRNGQTVQCF
jgi:hypothetical protein